MTRRDAPTPRPPDGLLIGPENALAHAAITAMAGGEPGLSPLVLHGPSGVGKSRLLAVLEDAWRARRPGEDPPPALLTAEGFAAHCAAAADAPRLAGGWADLRGRFRGVAFFALDDLPALGRAPWALAELVHTLDALDASGAAVAVAAPTGPGGWPASAWPTRLVSRLAAGLSVRIDPPGPDARRRYVLERARGQGLPLAAAAADRLAEAADGYRTIDGWLAGLALAARLDRDRRPIGREAVEAMLAGPDAVGRPTVDDVIRAVASRFGVTPRDLRSAGRGRALAVPRHLAIGLARDVTGLSFARIGAAFGGRDAQTVRHACAMSETRRAADPALAAVAEALALRWRRGTAA